MAENTVLKHEVKVVYTVKVGTLFVSSFDSSYVNVGLSPKESDARHYEEGSHFNNLKKVLGNEAKYSKHTVTTMVTAFTEEVTFND